MISLFFVTETLVFKVVVGPSRDGISGEVDLVPSNWAEFCQDRKAPAIDLDSPIEYSKLGFTTPLNGWLGKLGLPAAGWLERSEFFPVLRQDLGRGRIAEAVVKSNRYDGKDLVIRAQQLVQELMPEPRFGWAPAWPMNTELFKLRF